MFGMSLCQFNYPGASARLDPVNRPDLLPSGQTPVIDVAGFLTNREVLGRWLYWGSFHQSEELFDKAELVKEPS